MEEYFNTFMNLDFLGSKKETVPDKNIELVPVDQEICSGCLKNITDGNGFYIDSLFEYYHPNCFKCCKCKCSFSDNNPYIPFKGNAYCEKDYISMGAICFACKTPINGHSIFALGRNYHHEHFTCTDCKISLSNGFFEHDDNIYCEKHYKLKTLNCQICHQKIGKFPSVSGQHGLIHSSCLKCNFGNGKCNATISDKFYIHLQKPICEYHFHSERKTLCPACDTGIDGYCAEVDENTRFHRECWTCAACNCFLQGSYYIHMGGAYCEKDIKKLLPNSNSRQKRTTLLYNTLEIIF